MQREIGDFKLTIRTDVDVLSSETFSYLASKDYTGITFADPIYLTISPPVRRLLPDPAPYADRSRYK